MLRKVNLATVFAIILIAVLSCGVIYAVNCQYSVVEIYPAGFSANGDEGCITTTSNSSYSFNKDLFQKGDSCSRDDSTTDGYLSCQPALFPMITYII